MKRTHGFLLTAGLLLASAFTLSCSSDDKGDDTGGGINPSELSKYKIYLVSWDENDERIKEEYNGNGDVFLIEYRYNEETYEETYDTLSKSEIRGGQLSLNLPTSVDSKYVDRSWRFCEGEYYEDESCESTVVANPANALFNSFNHSVVIPGKDDYCYIDPRLIKSGERIGRASFIYSLVPVKITGKYTFINTHYDESEIENFNLNLLQGWNLMYTIYGDNGERNVTNSLPAGITLEWWIDC